jgi:hypothetical protein
VLFASVRDGGVDAFGHDVAESANVAQHLIVDTGQSCGLSPPTTCASTRLIDDSSPASSS